MADILRRIMVRKQSVWKAFHRTPSVRRIFSAPYTQPDCLKQFADKRKQELAGQDISSVCLLIDRCDERKIPFSSLTIDDMVHAIEDRDDIITSMYYLHKFRHCDEGYFLRPWTMHFWIKKCIEFGATDLALKVFHERSQYGIFSDDYSCSLLINNSLNNKDYDTALKFASQAFLSENLSTKASQISCLFVILKLMEMHETVNPEFSSLADKRNFFGICLRVGQLMSIKSLEVLGYAGLGGIELEHGIRSVYQDPWAPLMWTEGYLQKSISELDREKYVIHHEVLDFILSIANDDPLSGEAKEKISYLESEGLICEESLPVSLQEKFSPVVPEAEISSLENLNENVSMWISERQRLIDVLKQINDENALERDEFFHSRKLQRLAKKMAVERLGYWELLLLDDEHKPSEAHLRDDYVDGSSSDIQIEKRIDAS